MYKAIQVNTGEEIIILHPRWKSHVNHLREMDHADLLVCQGCSQPLRVKAGELKRPHFAHKHLKACSYGTESAEILQARAVLYEWLLPYFGERVTVEKKLAENGLPRPVDCWVEAGGSIFAYWIFEAGIKPEPREAVKKGLQREGVMAHWIFLRSMLNEEKKEFHSVLLTPTERTFLQQTPYDELVGGLDEGGASIHYLDADNGNLITYRGLTLHHKPNWYKGLKKEASLKTIRADMLEGGFIYPGESARLQASRQKKLRLEQKRKQYETLEIDNSIAPTKLPKEGWGIAAREKPAEQLNTVDSDLPERQLALPCVTCGQITDNYWATFTDPSGRRLCRCRECLYRET